MDEGEVQIVASCMTRGVSWEVPLMRYVIERDRKRAEQAWEEYIARLAHNGAGESHG